MYSPKYLILATGLLLMAHLCISAKQAVVSKKSKLCGDQLCNEVLFKSRVKRVMGVNTLDPNFLKFDQNSIIEVLAVKFSDRPDIMEGKLDDGSRGFFYAGAIDTSPYVEFLRNSIATKKEMQIISQDNNDVGNKRVIGVLHSESDLVRDYNAKAMQVAREQGLPDPELLPIPQPPSQGHGHSHGHSHGGHGHSHDGHGHSHNHPDGSSHAAPITTPAPAQQPTQVPKVVLKNVLGTPPSAPELENKVDGTAAETLASASISDEEIERLIQRDIEIMQQKHEESDSNGGNVVSGSYVVEREPITTQPPFELPPRQVDIPQLTTPIPIVVEQPPPVVEIQPPVVENLIPVVEQPLPVVETQESVMQQPPVVEQPLRPPVNEALKEDPITTPAFVDTLVLTTLAPVVEPQIADAHPPEVLTTPASIVDSLPTTVSSPPIVDSPSLNMNVDILATATNATPSPISEDPVAPLYDEVSPSSVAQAEVSPVVAPQGYCDKDECETLVSNKENVQTDREPERKQFEKVQPHEDTVGQFKDVVVDAPPQFMPEDFKRPSNFVASIVSVIRSTLGLTGWNDASIGALLNWTFVVASIFIFIVSQSLFSSSDSLSFDKRQYYNLSTRCRKLEAELKNAGAGDKMSAATLQELELNQQEINRLVYEVRSRDAALENLNARIAESGREAELVCQDLEERKLEVARLRYTLEDFEQKLEHASQGKNESAKQFEQLNEVLKESQLSNKDRQKDIDLLRKEKNAAQKEVETMLIDLQNAIEENKKLENELKRTETELHETKLSLAEVVKQYEKHRNEGSAEESGGSGNWSDFGDEFSDEKTPEMFQLSAQGKDLELQEIRTRCKKYGDEFMELKPKLQKAEEGLVKYKSAYERVEKEKSELETKLKSIDFENLKTKIETLESEKRLATDKKEDLLKVLDENLKKLSDTNNVISGLRDELSLKREELLEEKFTNKKKDEKIREVENEMKRMRVEHEKYETKWFHEVRVLKQQLNDIKTSQILNNVMLPSSDNLDVFGPPPDSEARRGPSPRMDPIWDEPTTTRDLFHSSAPLSSDDFGAGGSLSKKNRSRRSERLLVTGENSPSDSEKRKEKKDVHRRRSRSHGRTPYGDPYYGGIPGSVDTSYMNYGFAPLTDRHSKSGHLNYASSGGSNGGRSPPLLSNIPLPGVRKPTIYRPTD